MSGDLYLTLNFGLTFLYLKEVVGALYAALSSSIKWN